MGSFMYAFNVMANETQRSAELSNPVGADKILYQNVEIVLALSRLQELS